MNYIFDFDIAAILVNLIIIFFCLFKKNIPTRQNRIFLIIVCCLGISSILDLYLTLQLQYKFSVPNYLLWVLNCLDYTSTNIFGILFTLYCLSIVNYSIIEEPKYQRIVYAFLFIPFALTLVFIWFSPIFYVVLNYPLVFYIDNAGNYFRATTWFNYSIYLFCLYYVIVSFAILFRYKKMLYPGQLILLFIYVVVVFITVFIQFFIPRLLVQCFGMTLASLVFYFFIQKPEEYLDSVSNLFNQTAFIKVIPQQIDSSGNLMCICIMLDDTYFLSNTFGMARLDDFIREVSKYLKKTFKGRDIYHLGQGCFCIVMDNPPVSEIDDCVNTLKARFNQIWTYESIHIKLYSRFCVICCPVEARNPEEVIDIIDLVSSDDRYRQSVVMAEDLDLEYKRRTRYIDHTVRFGLAENRMEVYYQPIWSASEKRLIGAEALVRLKDDEGRYISPEDFIPIAEKNGAILRIGEFVFESVCRTLSSISCEKLGIKKIDINLSVAQCMQEILAEQILTIRSLYNIPASLINLEITETAAAHTPEILLHNMQNLADAGFELSLDDYGSGYSNMNYMLNLPFKMIKIDKSIVWAAFNDKRAKTALEATISMIRKLDMVVLAEGVEKEEHVKWLTKLGCEYLQGYYYSKPVPKEEFIKLMYEDVVRYEKENGIVHEEDDSIEVL